MLRRGESLFEPRRRNSSGFADKEGQSEQQVDTKEREDRAGRAGLTSCLFCAGLFCAGLWFETNTPIINVIEKVGDKLRLV